MDCTACVLFSKDPFLGKFRGRGGSDSPGNSRPAQPCLKSGEASPEAERRVAACEFSPAIKGRSACLVPRAPARGSICSSYSVND